jgi:four helix bundle protein
MSTEADRRPRPKAKCVQDLEVYRIAYRLVIELYRDSAAFPSDERYGLTSQIRRAAVSIPANIAEGFRRAGLGEKAHFLNIAQASLEEVRTLLCLAHDLRLCPPSHLLGELEQLARMLHSYRAAIVQKLGSREGG